MRKAITVLGEISSDNLGVTMPHEHVICDISKHSGKSDNLLNDVDAAIEEVAMYRTAGGSTLVDVTTEDIGRNPEALKAISKATGVNIITCTGFYNESIYPDYVLQMSTDELACYMIKEIISGIGDTGIKPGIIGELAAVSSNITPQEEKVLRASSIAHNETGLAISLHAAIGRPALSQIAVLKSEGVSLEKVVACHADCDWNEDMAKDIDYYLRVLAEGCYLEFDMIGWNIIPEAEDIKRIMILLDKGYSSQLLLSSDLCRRSFYHRNDGRGYDYVMGSFADALREQGASEDAMRQMLVENPRKLLAV